MPHPIQIEVSGYISMKSSSPHEPLSLLGSFVFIMGEESSSGVKESVGTSIWRGTHL